MVVAELSLEDPPYDWCALVSRWCASSYTVLQWAYASHTLLLPQRSLHKCVNVYL